MTVRLAALACALTCLCAVGAPARAATPRVEVPGAGASIRVVAAAGEIEDAAVVVHGARGRLAVQVQEGSADLVPLGLSVLRVTTTRVDGRAVADPLPPLARRSTAAGGAPVRLLLRFRVPEGTPAGTHDGGLVFSLDGRPFATVAVHLRVFGVQLPARDDPAGFRTLFLVQPQTYVDAVARRSRVASRSAGPGITDRLYAFLSDYRLSPGDWGSGTPWPDGYSDRPGWSAAARHGCPSRAPSRFARCACRSGRSARRPRAPASPPGCRRPGPRT